MNRLRRLLMPHVVGLLTSPLGRSLRRRVAELKRGSGPHVVRYFHQPDDPYSHLAAQVLPKLAEKYDIQLEVHLVGPPPDGAAPERDKLVAYARKDAADIAPYLGLRFPPRAAQPSPEEVERAARLLAGAGSDVVRDAARIGDALWSGDVHALDDLPVASAEEAARALAAGSALRDDTGHYLGATFHYGGEWYWGVDRLHYLEARLQELGLLRSGEAAGPLVAMPDLSSSAALPATAGHRVTLEFFPSLRSPYTCISMNRVFALADRLSVELVLRPVLPMVMRGLPVPKAKFLYIITDTKREADRAGEPFGRACDPVGRPIERALSLFPWAREQGRARALLHAFTQAAFTKGVDTHTDAGLRQVVQAAGLSWEGAQPHLDTDGWRPEIEENRRVMFEAGLWGVPSFRILVAGQPVFATWGQDRLWLVEAKLLELQTTEAEGVA